MRISDWSSDVCSSDLGSVIAIDDRDRIDEAVGLVDLEQGEAGIEAGEAELAAELILLRLARRQSRAAVDDEHGRSSGQSDVVNGRGRPRSGGHTASILTHLRSTYAAVRFKYKTG